ncbi:MAG: hypothetical protein Q8K24_00690 [Hydrogenophaga sp.]|nr:hypothetical protein [Hydrogenophaga sp.]
MASKSSTTARRSTESEQTPMNMAGYQQFADLTENSAALFREIEAVQQIHQHSAQRSALKLQQAAEQMRNSTSSTELLSIQSTLMMGGMQEMVQYMQELSVTLLRMQVALVPKQPFGRGPEGTAASGLEGQSAHPLSAASTAQDAATAATAAVLQSWTNMLGAGLHQADGRSPH